MAWTYSGDPANSDRDKVRFLIGDTDTTNQLLQDAEIAYLLSVYDNDPFMSAVMGCRSLASKFSAKADYSRSVGDLSISTQYGATADRYLKLADTLTAQATDVQPPSPDFNSNAVGNFKFSVDMDRFV